MSDKPDEHQLKARMLRLLAAKHRARAATLDMEASMVETSRNFRRLAELLTEAEIQEIAEHPDLAELNAQLDGYYGD